MGLPSLEILEVSWTSFSASLANQAGFEQELEQRPPQLPSYLHGPVTQGSVFTAQLFFVAPLQPPPTSHPHFPLSKCCSTSRSSLGAPSLQCCALGCARGSSLPAMHEVPGELRSAQRKGHCAALQLSPALLVTAVNLSLPAAPG